MVGWVKIFADVAEAERQLPAGKPRLVVIDGERICVVRHADKFYAVQDSCTHSGESLSKGHLNYLGEVICPLHNHCFNLQTGREIQSRSADLHTYPIKIDDSGFFIGV